MKKCSKCQIIKDKSDFGNRSDRPHLLRSHCNQCTAASMRVKYDSNKDEFNQKRNQRYADDEAYRSLRKQRAQRDWMQNKVSKTQVHKEWVAKNRDKVRAYGKYYVAMRRALQKKATPPWADLHKIREIYKNCPEGYHVDHIYPLNHKDFCGLHVPENLQYLPASENLSKGNRLVYVRNGG